MTYFFKKSKNEAEIEKVNNEHRMLIDEHDDYEDDDYETKHCKINKEVTCNAFKMNDDNEKN